MSKATAVASVNPSEWADRIVSALAAGLVKASEILKEYIAKGGDIMALQGATPINPDVWKQLSDVASGRVDPRLFSYSWEVIRALLPMPREMQTKIIDEGFDVLSTDGSALRVSLKDATKTQRTIAFARDHIRTLPEQKAVASTLLAPPPPPAGSRAYVYASRAPEGKAQIEVRGGKVYIVGSAVLTAADLLRFLGLITEGKEGMA